MKWVFLSMGFSLLLISHTAWAIPSAITYQGALKDRGAPANGSRQMSFRITNQDGTQVYWSSGNIPVPVHNGLFSVQISPTGIDWAKITPFMEVSIEGQQLLPREPVSATVYAAVSNRIVDGAVGPSSISEGFGLVPRGMIGLFDSACPSGWTRFSALDQRMPMGHALYGETGGSSAHQHTIASDGDHDHGGFAGSAPGDYYQESDAGRNFGTLHRTHRHPIGADGAHHHGGVTLSTSTWPPYLAMVYCQKQ